ncbi:MAG TPA: putative metal-dependent hydrolase [Phnomibacter sp.]|nr:putative metal-dependent hydrolase [Phnomibacter sp.]
MIDLRYPIGKFEPQPFSEATKSNWLNDIAQLPALLEAAIENLDEAQLHTPYRDGGWTVHQVVHHVADSHINAFCRMKLTLSDDNPTVRAYDENEWVRLGDATLPVNNPLTILHALHQKMYVLMRSVADADWNRTYVHSYTQQQNTLWNLLGMYAWHGKHHVAHITSLRERNNW